MTTARGHNLLGLTNWLVVEFESGRQLEPLHVDVLGRVAVMFLINLTQIAHTSFHVLVMAGAVFCKDFVASGTTIRMVLDCANYRLAPRLMLHEEQSEDHDFVAVVLGV